MSLVGEGGGEGGLLVVLLRRLDVVPVCIPLATLFECWGGKGEDLGDSTHARSRSREVNTFNL